MASEKKVILLFTDCDGSALTAATSPALAKLRGKGTVLSHVSSKDDIKTLAATGAKAGETLWGAAVKEGFVVANYTEEFDMCVLDAAGSADAVEAVLAPAMEAAGRSTLIAVVAKGAIIFYGSGIAKGKVVDTEYCPCTVAATVAYVADFPVPENCMAPVCYAALKDINYKLKEIQKFQTSIVNMEAAMERQSRKPWDKHDCA